MDMSAFMEEFRAEAADHIRSLDAHLLQLERDPADPAPIRAMFLSAHTIKGGAAMMGLEEARELAHAMEDVLGYLRDQQHPLNGDTADLLFRALDKLRDLLQQSHPGGPPDPDLSALVADLRQRAGGDWPDAFAPVAEQAPPPKPRALLVEDSATVRFLEQCLLSDAGFEVEAVSEGKEALALALAKPYRLVVAGMELRGLRGPELVACFRDSQSCSHLPVILMGCEDDEERRREAVEAGAQVYLRRGSFRQQRLLETALALLSGQ